MEKTNIYTIVFWASLFSILAWVILKATGVINTPLLIQLFPIIGAVFAAGAFYQMSLDTRRIVLRLQHDTYSIDKRVAILEADKPSK